MKEKTVTVYESFDGLEHDTEAKAVAHEKEYAWKRLIGLTEDDVVAALNGEDTELAEAMVTVGYRIANANRKPRTPKTNPSDKEPFLPHPVGGDNGGPPEPMTAEQALNHVRA